MEVALRALVKKEALGVHFLKGGFWDEQEYTFGPFWRLPCAANSCNTCVTWGTIPIWRTLVTLGSVPKEGTCISVEPPVAFIGNHPTDEQFAQWSPSPSGALAANIWLEHNP